MKEKRTFFSFLGEYWVELVIFVVGFGAMFLIFIPKAFRQSTTVDPEYAGWLGSFVGGYFGPIFSLIAVLLLFRTLKVQRVTSSQQGFENKYFELLKMHRDNVAEIGIKGGAGRKVFVLLIRELRCALKIIKETAGSRNLNLTDDQLMHVAYYCLFYGTGPNSSRMLKLALKDFDSAFIDAVEAKLNKDGVKKWVQRERGFAYVPFEGHQSRLGHYYRHLYQMVRFVDEQKEDLRLAKYEYVKTIRAQLSTHEQALLLINSKTPMGRNWWEKDFINRYRLVQNIPEGIFDSEELLISKVFTPGYFEWEEGRKKASDVTGTDNVPISNAYPLSK